MASVVAGEALSDMDRVELAPGMGPAGDLLERSLVVLHVLPWVLALTIERVGEPHGRGGRFPASGPAPPLRHTNSSTTLRTPAQSLT
jgi:hypothetical protein